MWAAIMDCDAYLKRTAEVGDVHVMEGARGATQGEQGSKCDHNALDTPLKFSKSISKYILKTNKRKLMRLLL